MTRPGLRFALVALWMATSLHAACVNDDSPGTAPNAGTDASLDVAAPDGSDVDATDSSPPTDAPFDAGFAPIDPSTIRWELYPSLPADGVRAGSECDVAVDADDRVLVTYGESADGFQAPRSLSVFRYEGSTWSTVGGAPLVAPSPSWATWPRLAVAKDGAIYVGYNHGTAIVQRFASGAWSALPATGLASFRGIAVDANGQPVVVGRNDGKPNDLVRWNGIGWSTPTTPIPGADAGGPLETGVLSAATRADGALVVIARSGAHLQAFTLDAANTWTALGAPFAEGGEYPELSSSPSGGLAVGWSGAGVFAARLDPSAQAFVPLGGALGDAGARYGVVALDPFDRPYLAWREQTANVKVSVYLNGAWLALPDPVATRGTLPAIALDRRGLPVVCWEAERETGVANAITVARGVSP